MDSDEKPGCLVDLQPQNQALRFLLVPLKSGQ
jgi:hypothetical protein